MGDTSSGESCTVLTPGGVRVLSGSEPGRPLPGVEIKKPRMQRGPLLQRRAHSPVQAVLEVQHFLPLHDMREEIPVERAVLAEQVMQIQVALGGDEFVDANLPRRQVRPLREGQAMLRIGLSVANRLENHGPSVGETGSRKNIEPSALILVDKASNGGHNRPRISLNPIYGGMNKCHEQ